MDFWIRQTTQSWLRTAYAFARAAHTHYLSHYQNVLFTYVDNECPLCAEGTARRYFHCDPFSNYKFSVFLTQGLSMVGEIFSRQHYEIFFLFFPQKTGLAFDAYCFPRRQSAWNAKKKSISHQLNLSRLQKVIMVKIETANLLYWSGSLTLIRFLSIDQAFVRISPCVVNRPQKLQKE